MRRMLTKLSPDLIGRFESGAAGIASATLGKSRPWIEVALIVACAAQAASLIWTLAGFPTVSEQYSPSDSSSPKQAERSRLDAAVVFSAHDPFKGDGPSAGGNPTADGPLPATALNLELFGVRVAPKLEDSRAIIRRPDGTQDVFAAGQTVIDSVVLESIATDQVVIKRSGVREALSLDQRRMPASVLPDSETTPQPSSRRRISSAPSALFQAVDARPETVNNRPGFALTPRGDGMLFAEAGFEAGDVLVAIDGFPVTNAAALSAATQRLGDADTVEVELLRRGNVLRSRLQVDR